MFQLQNDVDKDIMRVCGGKEDCRRPGHKNEPSRGAPGSYETIKTSKYTDGILSSYRTEAAHLAREAEERAIKRAAMSQLTGAKGYRHQVRAAEEEQDEIGEAGNEDGTLYESTGDGETDDWDEESDYDVDGIEVDTHESTGLNKTPKKGTPKGGSRMEGSPTATETRGNTGVRTRTPPGSKHTSRRSQHQMMTTPEVTSLVVEMKDAMKEMAEAMSYLLRRQEAETVNSRRLKSPRKGAIPQTQVDSSDEEEESAPPPCLVKGKKRPTTKACPRSSSPTISKKWYYAVARGKNPGVYTDWPRAEGQVNGFSGAMHKSSRSVGMRSVSWR
jgi:hypothetical protein